MTTRGVASSANNDGDGELLHHHHPQAETEEFAPSLPARMQSLFSISQNVIHTLDPCVVLMKELSSRYAEQWRHRGGIVSLAQGVVHWKPPPSVTSALIQALTEQQQQDDDDTNNNNNPLHLYGPDEGLSDLREVLRQKIERENGLTHHTVMVTTGANQAYMNCVLTLLNSSSSSSPNGNTTTNEDLAVVFCPYYFNHVMALQMTISPERIRFGPIDLDTGLPDLAWLERQFEQNSVVVDVDDNDRQTSSSTTSTPSSSISSTNQRSRINNIRMVTLVNPGNPTGIALSKEQVQPLVDLCRRYNCWLILDASYEYFVHTTDEPTTTTTTLKKSPATTAEEENDDKTTAVETEDSMYFKACFNEEHCIHIFSLSKSYALAGYRCGYIALPKPKIILQGEKNGAAASRTDLLFANMLKVQDTIPIAPSRFAQVAAMAAMQQAGPAWVQAKVATLRPGRAAILHALSLHLDQTIGGSGAMYVMGQLPQEWSDRDVAERLVRDHGVAVIPGSFCGFPGWIRVCYANLPPDRCILAAQRLEQGLRDILKVPSTPRENQGTPAPSPGLLGNALSFSCDDWRRSNGGTRQCDND